MSLVNHFLLEIKLPLNEMDCCYRFYTLTRFKSGLSATKLYEELFAVHGDTAPSKPTIVCWVAAAKTSSLELQKGAGPGRPIEAATTGKIGKVKVIIEAEARMSCRDIALEAGIDKSTVYRILVDVLGLRNFYSVWVPWFSHADTGLFDLQKCQIHKAELILTRPKPLRPISIPTTQKGIETSLV